jgi:hypothetical protein
VCDKVFISLSFLISFAGFANKKRDKERLPDGFGYPQGVTVWPALEFFFSFPFPIQTNGEKERYEKKPNVQTNREANSTTNGRLVGRRGQPKARQRNHNPKTS